MIFVTTGTQEPFDRLLKIISKLAHESDEEIVIQAKTGLIFPNHVTVKDFVTPIEFGDLFGKADLVISHAGMGTIISALQNRKPLVVFPRIASLGEHRNEHQMATARKMKELDLVSVVFDEEELYVLLESYLMSDTTLLKSENALSKYASLSLINSIESFIKI